MCVCVFNLQGQTMTADSEVGVAGGWDTHGYKEPISGPAKEQQVLS